MRLPWPKQICLVFGHKLISERPVSGDRAGDDLIRHTASAQLTHMQKPQCDKNSGQWATAIIRKERDLPRDHIVHGTNDNNLTGVHKSTNGAALL